MTTQNTNTPSEPVVSGGSSGAGRGGLLALLSVALVGGVMYSAYQFGKRPGEGLGGETSTRAIVAANGDLVTVVSAPEAPLRSAPENPGGRVAPDQDRAAYESLGPRPIEPASARVTALDGVADEAERPVGAMAARAVDSAAATPAGATEIHGVGLGAVPPRTDMARPTETFALSAPERNLSAPGLAAALSSSSGGAGAPASAQTAGRAAAAAPAEAAGQAPGAPLAGPRVASAGGAPLASTTLGGPRVQTGPTLAAAQAQAAPGQAPAGQAPAGQQPFAPSAAGAAPATAAAGAAPAAALSEAPQAAPAPRPRPAPAAAPSVVAQLRSVAGVEGAAPPSAAVVARTQTPAAPAQPAAGVGFAPQSQVQAQRVFAPGEATMVLGQDFVAAAAGLDPRAAAAQSEAQRQAEAYRLAQAQAEALRLAQAPAQPYGAPAQAQPQQYAYAQQPPAAAQAAPARGGAQIQLGALPSPEQVQQRWAALQRSNPDLLGSLRLDIQPVTTGAGQQLFRLRAGPLIDMGSARNLCAALQARGVDCYAPPS